MARSRLGVMAPVIAATVALGCAHPSAAPATRQHAASPTIAPIAGPASEVALPPLPPPSSPITPDRCVDRTGDCHGGPSEPPKTSESSDTFDLLQAIEALSRVELSGCRRFDWSYESGTAEVFFEPSGDVRIVILGDKLEGTSTGQCIADRLRRVRVAPFAGRRSVGVRRFFSID